MSQTKSISYKRRPEKDSRCFVGFETYVPKMNLSVENGSSSSRHAVIVSS